METGTQFPKQQLPFNRKTKKWRKLHCDWADSKSMLNYSPVRNNIKHKKINYDLLNGVIHMDDLIDIVNPNNVQASYIPEKIQHYPIINSKIGILRGEEAKRQFDFEAVVTNPNAVSDIEKTKKQQLTAEIEKVLRDQSQSEEDYVAKMNELGDFYSHEWQDEREILSNALIKHYWKEYNMPLIFNEGLVDALAVGEEIYMCDIVGGEPTLERLDPTTVRVFRSGFSNRIEDADVVVIENYWNPGRIIDTYYDVLAKEDIEKIETLTKGQNSDDSTSTYVDERDAFINADWIDSRDTQSEFLFGEHASTSNSPYDNDGNIRVLRVFWKSRRKIKKVKTFNFETGEEDFNFYPETYVINAALGEEEEIFYINEAWEGTKIGKDIYINMRPRVVQYNRLSNPSRCHFGIIGSIYNINNSKPFSLVDMMKPYSYYYDVLHDRMNKMIAKNWGKIITLDLAKVPKDWEIDKWMYFAKTNNLAIVDSFNEGKYGAATGKIAGGLNNASSGVIDAELGNSIQYQMNLLEYIKTEMSEVAGISKQREGQISNRETVGGVERATVQSSHITEWYFMIHDDLKRRVLECFLETAKIALKGRNKKFRYLLNDHTYKMIDIDGDLFAENDYGIVVDSSNASQELRQKLDMLAQAALQNQAISFSTIMKLYSSLSLSEKQRLIEKNEQENMQRQQGQQQQQMQQEQQQAEMEARLKEAEMQQKDLLNQRDNETKIIIANINASSKADDGVQEAETPAEKAALEEKIRQFNEKLKLDRDRLQFDKQKANTDAEIKRESIRHKTQKK